MFIGVPKEIKNRENRVAMLPTGVRALVSAGHRVLVERSAGVGSGVADEEYERAGAHIVEKASDAWNTDLVIKVKEPLPEEFDLMRPGQTLFTYLHLAADKRLTEELLEKRITGIAYETIQSKDGDLPLLRPMSEVAGAMSTQVGAYYLQSSWADGDGGRGVLLGGIPGVLPGKVAVIGGGVAGANAAKVALGMGALVTILDVNLKRLEYLEHVFNGRVLTLHSNIDNIENTVSQSDLVIGSVLVPGAKAPKLVTRKTISKMPQGSVAVDIAVDQGGCLETCRPTSHEQPVFNVDGVTHYCVTNMPGAVARTSTFALTNVTLKYTQILASAGSEAAGRAHPDLALGFNTFQGKLVQKAVAEAHDLPYSPLEL